MTLVIPESYAQASLIFTGSPGTQPFVTTIGIRLPTSGYDYVRSANRVMNDYADAMRDITNPALLLSRCQLHIGSSGPSGSVDSDAPPVTMQGSGAHGPMAMAAIARKVTPELGRHGRGRMFLPGVNQEAAVEADGSLTGGYRTALQTALDLFYSKLATGAETGESHAPYLFHGPNVPEAPSPITGFTVSPIVGWIRGRIR